MPNNVVGPEQFVAMDEEGFFNSQGVRWEDPGLGSSMFETLRRSEVNRSFLIGSESHPIVVEAFDQPLVGCHLSPPADSNKSGHRDDHSNSGAKNSERLWRLTCTYGVSKTFRLKDLALDEWDRVHGVTFDQGLPFVLSRTAQIELFNGVDEVLDDALIYRDDTISLPFWLGAGAADISAAGHWNFRYENCERPGWDLGGASPVLKSSIQQIKLNRSRILVLGCGFGHDAAWLSQQGHSVTGVDFSAKALAQAQNLYGQSERLVWSQQDIFSLPESFRGQFDLVFDHTLYCAIDPQRRNELVRAWKFCLHEKGQVLGIFFCTHRPDGPPYGGSEWELRQRFKKEFRFLYWTRVKNSLAKRLGEELVVFMEKP